MASRILLMGGSGWVGVGGWGGPGDKVLDIFGNPSVDVRGTLVGEWVGGSSQTDTYTHLSLRRARLPSDGTRRRS